MVIEWIFRLLPISIAFLGLLFVGKGIWNMRSGIAISGTRGKSILSLSGGYIQLEGTAERARETVTAPFTGTECVAYEASVEQYIVQNGSDNEWTSYHTSQEGAPFFVTDDSGSVLVEPDGADLQLSIDHTHISDSGTEPTGPYERYVQQYDIYTFDDEKISKVHEVRYVERRVDIGETTSVMGTLVPGASDIPGASAVVRSADEGFLSRLLSKSFVISDSEIEASQLLAIGFLQLLFGGITAVAMVPFATITF